MVSTLGGSKSTLREASQSTLTKKFHVLQSCGAFVTFFKHVWLIFLRITTVDIESFTVCYTMYVTLAKKFVIILSLGPYCIELFESNVALPAKISPAN